MERIVASGTGAVGEHGISRKNPINDCVQTVFAPLDNCTVLKSGLQHSIEVGERNLIKVKYSLLACTRAKKRVQKRMPKRNRGVAWLCREPVKVFCIFISFNLRMEIDVQCQIGWCMRPT